MATEMIESPFKVKVKKDKKEKRKAEDLGGQSSTATEGESKEERRARKKAKKAIKEDVATSDVEAVVTAVTAQVEETKEERKARRRAEKLAKELAEDTLPAEAASIDSQKKAKKGKKDSSANTTSGEQEVAPPSEAPADEVALKKSKKNKKKDVPAAPVQSEEGGVFGDSTLTDQAKKAIHYVQLHAATHGKKDLPEDGQRWKFNKAKQGWLMRNVWNDAEVPEAYFDQVVFYLKTLPGLARKGMIETAKKHQNAPIPGAEEEESEKPGAETEEPTDAETKEVPETKEVEKAEEEEEASTDAATVEMRRERAQRILKALGAR